MTDASRFPRLARYVEQLPAGLSSYPECLAKASLLRASADALEVEIPGSGLPAVVHELLVDPPVPSSWIPQAHCVAAHVALADMAGLVDDVDLVDWSYRANKALAASTMYRVLVQLASPRALLRLVPISWRTIHRGIVLDVDSTSSEKQTLLIIRHPPHVWTREVHQTVAGGFRPPLEASRARDVRVELVVSETEGAEYLVSWR